MMAILWFILLITGNSLSQTTPAKKLYNQCLKCSSTSNCCRYILSANAVRCLYGE